MTRCEIAQGQRVGEGLYVDSSRQACTMAVKWQLPVLFSYINVVYILHVQFLSMDYFSQLMDNLSYNQRPAGIYLDTGKFL